MARLASISDLHLGDRGVDGSILDSEQACAHFAELVGQITRGRIDTLVINGDLFEACVPERSVKGEILGKRADFGLVESTLQDAYRFFTELAKQVTVNLLVWVPGNHDYSLFTTLMPGRRSYYTRTMGEGLRAQGKWYVDPAAEKLFGPAIKNIAVAYPNFLYKSQAGWPFAVFTHGHLFDSQVLNPNQGFLETAGITLETGKIWPAIPRHFEGNGPWMRQLVDATSERILKIWPMNLSLVKEAAYNYVKRRGIQTHCSHRPTVPGYRENNPTFVKLRTDSELTGDIHWYCDGLMFDEAPPVPASNTAHSYFVKGHTHDGTFAFVRDSDDKAFEVIDLGGWTTDAEVNKNNIPHAHVLVWEEFPAEPTCYALNVGRP
jgi:hypothetical protein